MRRDFEPVCLVSYEQARRYSWEKIPQLHTSFGHKTYSKGKS
jgi:hypothetical protein